MECWFDIEWIPGLGVSNDFMKVPKFFIKYN